MRRLLPGMVLGAGLACAGAFPSGSEIRTFSPLTIELMSGRVTEDLDHGASGDFSVEQLLSSQSLGWAPLEADYDAEARAHDMWRATRALLADHDEVDIPDEVAVREISVDGQAGWRFAAEGNVHIHATAWPCPAAGVMVNLVTTGLGSSARQRHERSLASVRCATAPPELAGQARTWRFVGEPGRWTEQDGADAIAATWVRSDERVFLGAESAHGLVDPALPNLCVATLRLSHEQLAEDFAVDESANLFANTADGCVHSWAGTRREDGAPVRGSVRYRSCGGPGFVQSCITLDEGLPLAALCDNVVACAAR